MFLSIDITSSAYKWLAILISVIVIIKVLEHFSKKREMEKLVKERRRNISVRMKEVISLQDDLYQGYDNLRNKAMEYEDLRSVERLDRLAEQLEALIIAFNEYTSSNDLYYEELLEHINGTRKQMHNLMLKLQEIERSIQDLREIHHGKQEEQEEWRKKVEEQWRPIPFAKSKYFRGCKDSAELSKRYHSLIKMYHPDNGGDVKVSIEINKEYKECQKQIRE